MQRDGRVGYVLRLDLHTFLGFHRLVQPITPAATGHEATGELIHNYDLAALHEIILITLEDKMCPQRLLQMTAQTGLIRSDVFRAVRVHEGHPQQLLNTRQTHLCDRDVAILFV